MSVIAGVSAVVVSCLTGRSAYRADELLSFNGGSGDSGGSYSNQGLFIGMDASLMVRVREL